MSLVRHTGVVLVCFVLTAALLVACSATPAPVKSHTQPATGCVVSAPPASLDLDTFYAKHCSVRGIPLVSAGVVPDAALERAWTLLDAMLSSVSGSVVRQMIANKTRVGIVGVEQQLTDMPEYRNLDEEFPLERWQSWNERARGLGATPYIPLASSSEENLLCYPQDVYTGKNLLLHEFAHTVLLTGVEFDDKAFRGRLDKAYKSALNEGLWQNTYAATTRDEYWAEGVQAYYNDNLEASPADGYHGAVNTHEELRTYDPALFALIKEVFGEGNSVPGCPQP